MFYMMMREREMEAQYAPHPTPPFNAHTFQHPSTASPGVLGVHTASVPSLRAMLAWPCAHASVAPCAHSCRYRRQRTSTRGQSHPAPLTSCRAHSLMSHVLSHPQPSLARNPRTPLPPRTRTRARTTPFLCNCTWFVDFARRAMLVRAGRGHGHTAPGEEEELLFASLFGGLFGS